MKFYRTSSLNESITEIEVEKHTEKSVWIRPNGRLRRTPKHGSYYDYWGTIDEAKEHLKQKYNGIIESAEKNIERAKSALESLDKY